MPVSGPVIALQFGSIVCRTTGMGFVFTDEDRIVVGLNDRRVSETRALTGKKPEIIETVASYTEIGPTGIDVHAH